MFINKEFTSGMYMFAEGNIFMDGDERLRNYKRVSGRLSEKYDMEDETEWHKDSWKDSPNYHGHAVSMGDVSFGEKYQTDRITIMHILETDSGQLGHNVMYASTPFFKMMQEESDNEF